MTTRTLYGWATTILLACTACADPLPSMDASSGDVAESAVDAGPRTLSFIMTSLDLGSADRPTRWGFNLDGVVSSVNDPFGCRVMDGMNPDWLVETGDGVGIDNQLLELDTRLSQQGLVGFSTGWARAFTRQSMAIAMRVSGVDNEQDDNNVQVSLYLAVPEFGAPCTLDNPMRRYAEWKRPGIATRVEGRGSIVSGRLLFGASREQSLVIPVTVANGRVIDVSLRGITLRVKLQNGTGTAGNLGARINSSELYSALIRMGTNAPSLLPSDALELSSESVDVQVADRYCTLESGATIANSGDISMGLGFALLQADINGTPVSQPIPNTCATQ